LAVDVKGAEQRRFGSIVMSLEPEKMRCSRPPLNCQTAGTFLRRASDP
jgi:hypothetical protein